MSKPRFVYAVDVDVNLVYQVWSTVPMKSEKLLGTIIVEETDEPYSKLEDDGPNDFPFVGEVASDSDGVMVKVIEIYPL